MIWRYANEPGSGGGNSSGREDEYMANSNGWRLRLLGLIGGHTEHQRPLGVSLIAADMRVIGDVHTTSVLTVAGSVLGDVSADDQVLVARGGTVAGGVEAPEVILNGEVRGSVDARERLEIQASAVVRGDVHARRLVVHEGALVDGDFSMSESGVVCERGVA